MRFVTPGTENGDGTVYQSEGVRSSVKQIVAASVRYAGARFRLAALETKLAAGEMKRATVLLSLALLAALTGFALLITGLVLWIARLFLEGNTAAASALTGVVLLGATWILLRSAMSCMKGKSFFPVTKTEFNRDKQWLHNLP